MGGSCQNGSERFWEALVAFGQLYGLREAEIFIPRHEGRNKRVKLLVQSASGNGARPRRQAPIADVDTVRDECQALFDALLVNCPIGFGTIEVHFVNSVPFVLATVRYNVGEPVPLFDSPPDVPTPQR